MWNVDFRTGRHRQESDVGQEFVQNGNYVSSHLSNRTKIRMWLRKRFRVGKRKSSELESHMRVTLPLPQ